MLWFQYDACLWCTHRYSYAEQARHEVESVNHLICGNIIELDMPENDNQIVVIINIYFKIIK